MEALQYHVRAVFYDNSDKNKDFGARLTEARAYAAQIRKEGIPCVIRGTRDGHNPPGGDIFWTGLQCLTAESR